jgi:hypothetical protein
MIGPSQDWYWDAFNRKYVTKEEKMAMETVGNQLADVGTRWQHLADMREIWANAVANLQRIQPGYRSVGDKKWEEKLSAAVELIDKQIDLMARYDMKKMMLAREIDAIPRLPKDKNADQDSNSPDQKV